MARVLSVVGSFASGALLALAVPAHASPLDPAQCLTLQAEVAKLESGDAGAAFSKGASWAKDHLTPAQIADVAHLIELHETLEFRCGRPPAQVEAAVRAGPDPEALSGEDTGDPKAEAAPKRTPKPKAEPKSAAKAVAKAEPEAKPHRKSAKAAAETAPATGDATPALKPQSTKAAAAKPKASDAFVPPPKPAEPASSDTTAPH